MTADSKYGFYVIYYQRMRWLLIVPRFQEPQNLKNSGCRGWTNFSRSWVLRGAVPLIRSAAWRNRTSKSFTDRMPSKHLQYHYGNTAYWLDESSFNYASDTEEHQPYTIKTRGIESFFKQHTWRNLWRWSRTTRIRRQLIYSQNRYLYGISTNAGGAFLLNCHLP